MLDTLFFGMMANFADQSATIRRHCSCPCTSQ